MLSNHAAKETTPNRTKQLFVELT